MGFKDNLAKYKARVAEKQGQTEPSVNPPESAQVLATTTAAEVENVKPAPSVQTSAEAAAPAASTVQPSELTRGQKAAATRAANRARRPAASTIAPTADASPGASAPSGETAPSTDAGDEETSAFGTFLLRVEEIQRALPPGVTITITSVE